MLNTWTKRKTENLGILEIVFWRGEMLNTWNESDNWRAEMLNTWPGEPVNPWAFLMVLLFIDVSYYFLLSLSWSELIWPQGAYSYPWRAQRWPGEPANPWAFLIISIVSWYFSLSLSWSELIWPQDAYSYPWRPQQWPGEHVNPLAILIMSYYVFVFLIISYYLWADLSWFGPKMLIATLDLALELGYKIRGGLESYEHLGPTVKPFKACYKHLRGHSNAFQT